MRNQGLDILRIIAVLLVIGRHFSLLEDSNFFLKAWQRGGWVGVDLFFVLSGFLISTILFQEYLRKGSIDIKKFLVRRGFKIYPAFWIFLVISLLIKYFLNKFPSKIEVIGEVFFLQNYIGGVWNHTWSLAVEEHFYIGLSLICFLLLSFVPLKPFRVIPLIFVAIAGFCLFLRILIFVIGPEYSFYFYLYGTHIRIDSLLFGVFLSYLWNFCDLESRVRKVPSLGFVILGTALLSPAFIFSLEGHKWIPVFGVILFYLGSGCLVLVALRKKTTNKLPVQVLAALGGASYSIYLWHMPVAQWGYKFLSQITGVNNTYFYLLNALISPCMVGWVLNRLLENPILLLRDRLFPSDIYSSQLLNCPPSLKSS